MTTEKSDIDKWFERGIEYGDRWMLIVCDMFDYEHYPVFIKENSNFWEIYDEYNEINAQKIMEVYDLSLDKYLQLNTHRAWNVPGNNT
jgi:hypothetical protein